MSLYTQGDLMIRTRDSAPGRARLQYVASQYGKFVLKKHNNGATIIHEGEKGDHFHVLEGENASLVEVPGAAITDLNSNNLKTWVLDAPNGAKIHHVDGKGAPTGGHDTIELKPGEVAVVTTQREQSYLENRQIPQYD